MPNSRRNTRNDVDRREVAAVLKSRLDEECALPLGARPSRAGRTRVKVLVTNGNATGSTHRGTRRRQAPCQSGGGVLSSVGVGRIKEERLPSRHRGVRAFPLTAVVNSEMNNRDTKVNNERLLTSATRRPSSDRAQFTVVSPAISGLNHRATTEYGRKYGRPNHSGISRRDLGAPKFWKRFRGSATKFGAPSPVAL
jgi:hypothetical protein